MKTVMLSVRLRKKRLSDGRDSLYLDVYSEGRRSYEFLKLYLVPETGRKSKSENRDTIRIAESMRIQRTAELQKSMEMKSKSSRTMLIPFIERCISKRNPETASTYRNVLVAVKDYFDKSFVIETITEDDVSGFFGHLSDYANHNSKGRTISKTTQNLYCNTFKTFLRQAVEEKLIKPDVFEHVKIVKRSESMRQYLTTDELKALARTRINMCFKRAFMFSCLTGLRRSDIKRLKWGDVVEQDGFTRIIFRQKKTGSVEYLDINGQALRYMGERGNPEDRVFPKFQGNNATNKAIQKWVESAGIHKKITFHCARHTFAVMMLTCDVDIYTTSKLLGHKDLATTQIYAKIVDKKKQEAINKMPAIL